MAHFVNIGGEACAITGGYANIDGEACKILCGHANIGGERCDIKFGVRWSKYNCTRAVIEREEYESTSTLTIGGGAGAAEGTAGSSIFYRSCTGNPTTGTYTFANPVSITLSEALAPNAVGLYHGTTGDSSANQITSFEGLKMQYGALRAVFKTRHFGYTTHYSYEKGTTEYGVVVAPEGELPEAGTRIEGSASSDFCVLRINNVYYYYVREE